MCMLTPWSATSVLLSFSSVCHVVRTFHLIWKSMHKFSTSLMRWDGPKQPISTQWKSPTQDCRKKIADFKFSYYKLSLSVTPKLHIVAMYHNTAVTAWDGHLNKPLKQSIRTSMICTKTTKCRPSILIFLVNTSKLLLHTTATISEKLTSMGKNVKHQKDYEQKCYLHAWIN